MPNFIAFKISVPYMKALLRIPPKTGLERSDNTWTGLNADEQTTS
jgi:hypothetical protein